LLDIGELDQVDPMLEREDQTSTMTSGAATISVADVVAAGFFATSSSLEES
jgi:hypothetical protein